MFILIIKLTSILIIILIPIDDHNSKGNQFLPRWVQILILLGMIVLLQAPETGDYRFFISSDDDSQLWVSTDEKKVNAKKILRMHQRVSSYHQWDKYVN